jgi:Spy/CpxP family protein refolding chaperone
MKSTLPSLLLAGAMALLVFPAPTARAQDSKGRGVDEILTGQRVKQLSNLLQLDDAQKEKVHPIVLDEFKSARTVKEDEKLPQQEKFAKTDAIHAAAKEKIKAVLTPEQLAKWDALEKKSAKKPKP